MKNRSRRLVVTSLMIIGTFVSAQSPAASSVRIGIAVPGVDGKIEAHVSPQGDVTVDQYPSRFDGSLKVTAMASPVFGRTLGDAACQAVENRALIALDDTYPADLRKVAFDNVRKDNAFTLDATVASFFGTSEFLQAAKSAALAAGVQATSFQIKNPLVGRRFDVALDLSDDALSKRLGDSDFLIRQLKAMLQTSGGLATGTSKGEVSAADLVCDLRSGKARLSVRVLGEVAAERVIEPLFEAAVARAFYRELKIALEETPETYTLAQGLVAGGVAVQDAATSAGATLDWRSIGVIAAKLFDERTGELIEVSEEDLQTVLAAPREGGERFEGQSSLRFRP